jgi:hypothetical protein
LNFFFLFGISLYALLPCLSLLLQELEALDLPKPGENVLSCLRAQVEDEVAKKRPLGSNFRVFACHDLLNLLFNNQLVTGTHRVFSLLHHVLQELNRLLLSAQLEVHVLSKVSLRIVCLEEEVYLLLNCPAG